MKQICFNRCVYVNGPGSTGSQCQGKPLGFADRRLMGELEESFRRPFPMVNSAEVPDDVSRLMRSMAKSRDKRALCADYYPGTESVVVRGENFGFTFTGLTKQGIEIARSIAPKKCAQPGAGPSCSNPPLYVDSSVLLRQAIILGSLELFDVIAQGHTKVKAGSPVSERCEGPGKSE